MHPYQRVLSSLGGALIVLLTACGAAPDSASKLMYLAATASHFLESTNAANERFNQDGAASISILDLAAMASHFLQNIGSCP